MNLRWHQFEGILGEKLTIVMISMHTSPLAQPGQGDAGGMNVYLHNLTNALVKAGHQVLSFTRKTSATDTVVVLDQTTGSRVIPLSAGQLNLPKEMLGQVTSQFATALITAVEGHANHPVVLHSHYWLSGVVALQVSATLRTPVIHTMHTLGAAKNSLAPGTEPRHRVEREAFICAHADIITANTAVEKHELIHLTGTDSNRVEVLHPGVDHHIFRPDGPTIWPGREPAASPKLLFAGRFQHYKGPHVIVEALAALRNRGFDNLPTVHFTGAVSGAGTYDVQGHAHLLGVAEHCSFSAPVSPAVLASYMRAADVVAMPSVSESFGLVALEAQACGTPVIAHRVGGLTTAVADGISGQLVESLDVGAWADVLETVVEQPQRWQAFGAAGIERAAEFSWSAMAHRLVEIYVDAVTSMCAASLR